MAEAIAAAADPAEQKRLSARYDHLQHELHRQDAYNIDHRIERVLDGLRFRRESFDQPVASLERRRAEPADAGQAAPGRAERDDPRRALEPPRHRGHRVARKFLLESSAAMIVVSHDRYFLDKVTNRTLELFDGTVDCLRRQFFGLLAAKGRAAAGRAADLREAADRDREDEGLHPPQRLRPEARPGRGPPQEAGADRAGGPAAGDRRAADAVSGGRPARRHRGPGRGAGARAYEPAACSATSRSTSCAASAGPCWAATACGKTTLLRCLLGLAAARRGTSQPRAGRGGRLLRPAIGRTGRRRGRGRRRAAGAQAAEPANSGAICWPRFGLTGERALQKVGQPKRRRAVPRRPGPAGRRGGQFPRARRADQPPRSLGPRCAGKGARGSSTGPCCW